MRTVTIDFVMPFKGQMVPMEWLWDEGFEYHSDVDYLEMAKDIVCFLPSGGPVGVRMKVDNQVIAAWSKIDEELNLNQR